MTTLKVQVNPDLILRDYLSDMLRSIMRYPKPLRNRTPEEIERRIAKRFGVSI